VVPRSAAVSAKLRPSMTSAGASRVSGGMDRSSPRTALRAADQSYETGHARPLPGDFGEYGFPCPGWVT
jgi:hypothetical protein